MMQSSADGGVAQPFHRAKAIGVVAGGLSTAFVDIETEELTVCWVGD